MEVLHLSRIWNFLHQIRCIKHSFIVTTYLQSDVEQIASGLKRRWTDGTGIFIFGVHVPILAHGTFLERKRRCGLNSLLCCNVRWDFAIRDRLDSQNCILKSVIKIELFICHPINVVLELFQGVVIILFKPLAGSCCNHLSIINQTTV